MNTTRIFALAIAVTSVLVGAARAQTGIVRNEVDALTRMPLRALAIPRGDLDASALDPSGDIHPAHGAVSMLTRARVRAELARWVAEGRMPVGETGVRFAEVNPSRCPHVEVPGLTRGQARQDPAAAVRDGDIPFGERAMTPAQLNPSRYAGARERDRRDSYAGK